MTMQKICGALVLTVGLAGNAFAQGAIFLVRHAERADAGAAAAPSMGADPNLSDAGRTRAAALASMLRDSGITAIYVTEYKRTQETAAPLAAALGLTPVQVPAADTPALVEQLRRAGGNVLVVGHSNTVPDVIRGIGVPTDLRIGDTEYDNLFIVSMGPPRLIRLRF